MFWNLLRYLLLPLVLIFALGYASIPLWAPSLLIATIKPSSWSVTDLKVGYPSHKNWMIEQANWQQELQGSLYKITFSQVNLTYNWKSLSSQQLPNITVKKASINLLNASKVPTLPIAALIPGQWLPTWPAFNIENFIFNGDIDTNQVILNGTLSHQEDKLKLLAKLSVANQADVYVDSVLSHNNQVETKLFVPDSSSPVAKITSTIKQQQDNYIWQGQGAINIPFSKAAFNAWLPTTITDLNVTQGKLSSHWKITISDPIGSTDDLNTWITTAYGEVQSQIQLEASNPHIKALFLDASFTHTLDGQPSAKVRLNEGSLLRITPDWTSTDIDPNLYQSLLLEQTHLTLSAGSPIDIFINKPIQQSSAGMEVALEGDVNATLENTHSVYQAFGQLSKLKIKSLTQFQGIANLSGYYLAPIDRNPWMKQLPIDLRQLQVLSEVAFSFDPKQWEFWILPGSKVSATQVESRREAGSIQLFASDKLNLTNQTGIELTYQPQQDYWTWSGVSVHLKPESLPSQGLSLAVSAGSSLLKNQPLEGKARLQATSINLPGWPPFQAQGTGDFNWIDDQLVVNYKAQLPPYVPSIEGRYTWQLTKAEQQLDLTADSIELAPLLPQLQQLSGAEKLPAALKSTVTDGVIDYKGSWHWSDTNFGGDQTFVYHDIDAQNGATQVTNINGRSRFKIDKRDNKQAVVTGDHTISADQAKWAPEAENQLTRVTMELVTDGWPQVGYQVAKFDARWLGGRIDAQQQSILPTNRNSLSLALYDLHLENLLKLTDMPLTKATGKISGDLTLVLDTRSQSNNGLAIENATLASSETGQITLSAPATVQQDSKTAYLYEIMDGFRFEKLTADVTTDADGELTLLARIVGQNQDFKDGQPIDFNLTLNPRLR